MATINLTYNFYLYIIFLNYLRVPYVCTLYVHTFMYVRTFEGSFKFQGGVNVLVYIYNKGIYIEK